MIKRGDYLMVKAKRGKIVSATCVRKGLKKKMNVTQARKLIKRCARKAPKVKKKVVKKRKTKRKTTRRRKKKY